MRAYEGMDEASDKDEDWFPQGIRVNKVEPGETGVNIHGEETILTGPERVWVTTENEAPIYLTRDDIFELGFMRSDPQRLIYKHKDYPTLFMIELFHKDYSVKDFVVRKIVVWSDKGDGQRWQLYDSVKPNKEDIQLVINDYAA